mgnify:CR=1 FL=1
MNSATMTHTATGGSPLRRLSNLLYRRPNLYLSMLLVPPLIWFGAIYLGSLLNLLWQGFYTFDDFTMAVTPDLTLANFAALFQPSNFDIILRTLSMAVAVSLASAVLAFPIAYYMARYTHGKTKAFFYIAVMMPMWASYIVKTYAWTLLLAKGGVAQWFVQVLHLDGLLQAVLSVPGVGGSTLSTSHLGRFMVFVYIWLPFMILPIQAALERLPPSLLHASADLGARPHQTFVQVTLPLAVPGIAAGDQPRAAFKGGAAASAGQHEQALGAVDEQGSDSLGAVFLGGVAEELQPAGEVGVGEFGDGEVLRHRAAHVAAGAEQAVIGVDQVVAVGAVAVQQDHEMAGLAAALRAVAWSLEFGHLAVFPTLISSLRGLGPQSGRRRR